MDSTNISNMVSTSTSTNTNTSTNTSTDTNIEDIIIESFEDIIDNLKTQITKGKIIDINELNENLNLIKDGITKYNENMNGWYDSKYYNDLNKLNNILEEFNSNSFIFEELSFVSINVSKTNSEN
jgi:hypothetical protein